MPYSWLVPSGSRTILRRPSEPSGERPPAIEMSWRAVMPGTRAWRRGGGAEGQGEGHGGGSGPGHSGRATRNPQSRRPSVAGDARID